MIGSLKLSTVKVLWSHKSLKKKINPVIIWC